MPAGSAGSSVAGATEAVVSSKKGARVREGPELSSAACGEIAAGTVVTLGERSCTVDGAVRVEIVSPLVGFVSRRCLRFGRARKGGRLFAISDVHSDHAENLKWLRETFSGGAFARDGLILAGDISSKMAVIRETLDLCAASFEHVSFVVGNHDLWRERDEPFGDSLEKRRAILDHCRKLGIHTRPAHFCGCVVAPVESWHHQSWDTEPEVTGWTGLPKAEQCMSDYYRCTFPDLDMMTDQVADYFDALNDSGGLDGAIADLRGAHPGSPLVTFSHFVPRIDLVPEKRFLYVPALNKAVGSRPLGDRIGRLAPEAHVFGHTHFGWDATLDGTRYLQACLAYPSERTVRLTTVASGPCPHEATALLVYDSAKAAFPPPYECGWSNFYKANERRPDVTHVVPDYVARAYKRVPGVGEVGWGDHVDMPAWKYGPKTALDSRTRHA